MDILIILLVVALALAPLSNFLPSKRQRHVARLREAAAVQGLFVEFRDLPGSNTARPGAKERPEQIIYYGMRLPPSRGELRQRRAWLAGPDGFRGLDHRLPPPPCTAQLPDAVLALSQEESSCGVYWKEPGDLADVALIVAALGAWRDALLGSSRPA